MQCFSWQYQTILSYAIKVGLPYMASLDTSAQCHCSSRHADSSPHHSSSSSVLEVPCTGPRHSILYNLHLHRTLCANKSSHLWRQSNSILIMICCTILYNYRCIIFQCTTDIINIHIYMKILQLGRHHTSQWVLIHFNNYKWYHWRDFILTISTHTFRWRKRRILYIWGICEKLTI